MAASAQQKVSARQIDAYARSGRSTPCDMGERLKPISCMGASGVISASQKPRLICVIINTPPLFLRGLRALRRFLRCLRACFQGAVGKK